MVGQFLISLFLPRSMKVLLPLIQHILPPLRIKPADASIAEQGVKLVAGVSQRMAETLRVPSVCQTRKE
jgi:hypothetical protein